MTIAKRGTWRHPRRKKPQTGTWEYNLAGDNFLILLDTYDPITEKRRSIVSYQEKPEWGLWKLEGLS